MDDLVDVHFVVMLGFLVSHFFACIVGEFVLPACLFVERVEIFCSMVDVWVHGHALWLIDTVVGVVGDGDWLLQCPSHTADDGGRC